MKPDVETSWVNDMAGSPRIVGSLEISTSADGVWIAGEPSALRSLAQLITWVANIDQEARPDVPVGERSHVHLYPRKAIAQWESLTEFSANTEICRLDAKGTGEFPERYQKCRSRKAKKTALLKKTSKKPSSKSLRKR